MTDENEIDIDSLSDEKFMELVDSQSEMSTRDEEIEDDEVTTEDTDTNTGSELDNEDYTENDDLDEGKETDDSTEDNEEQDGDENTQDDAEEDGSAEGDTDADNDATDAEDSEDNSTDDAEPGEGDDAQSDDNAKEAISAEEYERLKTFYEEVTGEFTASGRKVKGFTDPQKIIQAQQMAIGFSDKMAGFKQYRPYLNPLKERGLVDNPEKFDLLMSIADGDKEALKTYMKQNDIDPLELDMEEVGYKPEIKRESDINLAYEDMIEAAKFSGVDDKVKEVISSWDDDSVVKLLESAEAKDTVLQHMSTGIYDAAMGKIQEKKVSDFTGSFRNKTAIEQYRDAVVELEEEYNLFIESQKSQQNQLDNDKVEAEKARLAEELRKEEYVKKAEELEKTKRTAKKRVSSTSKRKTSSKKSGKNFDPLELDDDAFMELVDSYIG